MGQIALRPLEPSIHGAPVNMGVVMKIALDIRIPLGIQTGMKGEFGIEDFSFVGGQPVGLGKVLTRVERFEAFFLDGHLRAVVAGSARCLGRISGIPVRHRRHTRFGRNRTAGVLGGHTAGHGQQDDEQEYAYMECQNNLLVKSWPLRRRNALQRDRTFCPATQKKMKLQTRPEGRQRIGT